MKFHSKCVFQLNLKNPVFAHGDAMWFWSCSDAWLLSSIHNTHSHFRKCSDDMDYVVP